MRKLIITEVHTGSYWKHLNNNIINLYSVKLIYAILMFNHKKLSHYDLAKILICS